MLGAPGGGGALGSGPNDTGVFWERKKVVQVVSVLAFVLIGQVLVQGQMVISCMGLQVEDVVVVVGD